MSPPQSPITALPPSDDSHLEEVEPQLVERPDTLAEEEGLELARQETPWKKPPPRAIHPFDLRVVALLMPAAVFGLLARLGLDALVTYPGSSIFPLAWVQAAGCFAMGAFLGLREPISEYYPELYVALSSGFCGSLTTFSSWQLDVFLAWSNKTTPGGYHRIWIYDIMDGLTRLLFTLAISMASLIFGYKITTDTAPGISRILRRTMRGPPSTTTHVVVSSTSIIIYALTIPMYFVLSPAYRAKATAALLFSFPGAFTRYWLSVKLNTRHRTIPPGTLAANVIGTALLATFHVLQRSKGGMISGTACVMLQGLSDGYCGCLSTVSTFASECRTIPKWRAWRYVAISVILGQAVCVLIVGGAEWSFAVRDSLTCRA